MKFGPVEFTYEGGPQEFEGTGWHAELNLNISGTVITGTLSGSGTGFARMAARGIMVSVYGSAADA